jgi:hypothetical protein
MISEGGTPTQNVLNTERDMNLGGYHAIDDFTFFVYGVILTWV